MSHSWPFNWLYDMPSMKERISGAMNFKLPLTLFTDIYLESFYLSIPKSTIFILSSINNIFYGFILQWWMSLFARYDINSAISFIRNIVSWNENLLSFSFLFWISYLRLWFAFSILRNTIRFSSKSWVYSQEYIAILFNI